MGEMITLTAADGHAVPAYRAAPSGTPRAGIVVVQEIFGVNGHIRRVADGYAAAGYLAIAPDLFDRAEPNVQLGYGAADVERGRDLKAASPLDTALLDVEAAVDEALSAGKVGVVGYCWGGFLAFAAACRLPRVAAVSSYYGGGITGMLNEIPRAPTIFHFGERDKHITLDHVGQIQAAYPQLSVYIYPADHGFNCEDRAAHDAPSADLARARTLEFFADRLR